MKYMKYTLAERIALIVSYASLLGIAFSILYAKGTIESNTEMCVPHALFAFVAGTGVSLTVWSALRLLVSISARLRQLEEKK